MRVSGFLAAFVASVCLAQDTTGAGSIYGKVTRTDGTATAGVRVCLVETTRCNESDADGSYRIPDVRAGFYKMEVSTAAIPAAVTTSVEVRAGLAHRVQNTGRTTLRYYVCATPGTDMLADREAVAAPRRELDA